MTKIQVYTESKTIKFSTQQMETLKILKRYDVDVSRFIREAISEKIKREWKEIKQYKDNSKVPF